MNHCNTMVEDTNTMLSQCEKLINMLAAIAGEWVYDQWKAKSIEKRFKRKDLVTIGQNRQGRSIGSRRNSHVRPC
ncbi:hypothetical protein BGX30_011351 [Mortierella sp. GBA39]|nr:hypothetical protein BGX30_011351 [Mortierella sp. GBA39]